MLLTIEVVGLAKNVFFVIFSAVNFHHPIGFDHLLGNLRYTAHGRLYSATDLSEAFAYQHDDATDDGCHHHKKHSKLPT